MHYYIYVAFQVLSTFVCFANAKSFTQTVLLTTNDSSNIKDDFVVGVQHHTHTEILIPSTLNQSPNQDVGESSYKYYTSISLHPGLDYMSIELVPIETSSVQNTLETGEIITSTSGNIDNNIVVNWLHSLSSHGNALDVYASSNGLFPNDICISTPHSSTPQLTVEAVFSHSYHPMDEVLVCVEASRTLSGRDLDVDTLYNTNHSKHVSDSWITLTKPQFNTFRSCCPLYPVQMVSELFDSVVLSRVIPVLMMNLGCGMAIQPKHKQQQQTKTKTTAQLYFQNPRQSYISSIDDATRSLVTVISLTNYNINTHTHVSDHVNVQHLNTVVHDALSQHTDAVDTHTYIINMKSTLRVRHDAKMTMLTSTTSQTHKVVSQAPKLTVTPSKHTVTTFRIPNSSRSLSSDCQCMMSRYISSHGFDRRLDTEIACEVPMRQCLHQALPESMNMKCRLSIEQFVGQGAYADPYQLLEHDRFSEQQSSFVDFIDVEATATEARGFVMSVSKGLNSFMTHNVSFSSHIHGRYHLPGPKNHTYSSMNTSQHSVDRSYISLPSPKVFALCEERDNYNRVLPIRIQLNVTTASDILFSVPVGNAYDLTLVAIVTAIVTSGSALWLIYTVINTQTSHTLK